MNCVKLKLITSLKETTFHLVYYIEQGSHQQPQIQTLPTYTHQKPHNTQQLSKPYPHLKPHNTQPSSNPKTLNHPQTAPTLNYPQNPTTLNHPPNPVPPPLIPYPH